jgi:ABC-type spermidine/putrescine transport system permease subunit II
MQRAGTNSKAHGASFSWVDILDSIEVANYVVVVGVRLSILTALGTDRHTAWCHELAHLASHGPVPVEEVTCLQQPLVPYMDNLKCRQQGGN